jgi:hypothetical protein
MLETKPAQHCKLTLGPVCAIYAKIEGRGKLQVNFGGQLGERLCKFTSGCWVKKCMLPFDVGIDWWKWLEATRNNESGP